MPGPKLARIDPFSRPSIWGGPHHSGSQRDEITRRKPIRGASGIDCDLAEGRGRDHVRRRGGDDASLDESPPPAFLEGTHEPVGLECTEVIVHFLTRETDSVGE